MSVNNIITVKDFNNLVVKDLVLGDIHLGHHNNDTDFIVSNLKHYFLVNPEIKEVHTIYIAGDLFDRLLNADSDEYDSAVGWLSELVLYCKKYNIKLRILEGTPDHDWKQAKIFHKLIKKLNIEIDFKYIEDIHIEYMEDIDQHVLYVPDKNDRPAVDRFKQIKCLMKDLGITEIDKAVMHGNFKYQLPIVTEYAHDENDFLSIVKGYIHINHIHTASVFERIIAGGSFDRMRHAEEEKKGGIIATNKHGEISFGFIENTRARIFKTFDITNDFSPTDIENLHKALKDIPSESFIRIRVPENDELIKTVSSFRQLYNFKELKIDTLKTSDVKNATMFEEVTDVIEISINKDNIVGLLKMEIGAKLTDDQYKLMEQEINRFI